MTGVNACFRHLALVLLGLAATACGMTLGAYRFPPLRTYQSPEYDPYRARRADEQLSVRVETSFPIQETISTESGQIFQGIPIVIELDAAATVSWTNFATAFQLYEVQPGAGGARAQRLGFDIFPIAVPRSSPAVLVSGNIERYNNWLRKGDLAGARAHGVETLKSLAVRDTLRTQTLMLVCPGTPRRARCLVPRRSYELHITPSNPSDVGTETNRANPPSAVTAVYPFRLLRRSIPVTALTGAGLVLALLQWAGG